MSNQRGTACDQLCRNMGNYKTFHGLPDEGLRRLVKRQPAHGLWWSSTHDSLWSLNRGTCAPEPRALRNAAGGF